LNRAYWSDDLKKRRADIDTTLGRKWVVETIGVWYVFEMEDYNFDKMMCDDCWYNTERLLDKEWVA